MATFSERLAILITADGKGAIREIEKVGDTADRELGKAQSASERWGSTFVRTGALMVGASAVMGVGLFKAAQAFDEAHQAELRLENSLKNNPRLAGESTGAYLKLANAIQQKTAADGDAVVAGMAMLGTFRVTGDQIREITPLVVDYARKFGVDMVTANASVGKALDGNVGALKRNGVSIDENLFKTDRYAAVMQALRQQVGGFSEAEGQTFSGQLERLKNNLGDVEEAIGGGVVSVLNEMIPVLDKGISGFKGLDEQTGGTLGKFTTFATIGAGVTGSLLLILGGTLKAKNAIAELSEAFPRATTAAKAAGTAIGVIGVALAGIELARSTNQVYDLAEGLDTIAARSGPAQVEAFGAAVAMSDLGNRASSASIQLDVFRQLAEQNVGAGQRLIGAMQEAGIKTDAYEKILRQVINAQKQNKTDTDAASGSLQTNAEKMEAAYQASQKLANSQLGLQGAHINAQSAMENYNKVLADTESSQLDVDRATHGVITSFASYGQAVFQASKDAGDSTEVARDKQVAALSWVAGTLEPGSPLRANLEGYIADLNSIPAAVFTDISVAIRDAGGEVIASARNWIKRERGGPVTAGDPYIVGEKGPELFVPSASGMIVPNHALGSGGGGSAATGAPTVFNIYDATDPEKVMTAIARAVANGSSVPPRVRAAFSN